MEFFIEYYTAFAIKYQWIICKFTYKYCKRMDLILLGYTIRERMGKLRSGGKKQLKKIMLWLNSIWE